jgi:hypothetical protein
MQQTTFASVAWDKKGKITRRERFLADMGTVIPWSRLLALIEPHYPKAGQRADYGQGTSPLSEMRSISISFEAERKLTINRNVSMPGTRPANNAIIVNVAYAMISQDSPRYEMLQQTKHLNRKNSYFDFRQSKNRFVACDRQIAH